MVLGGSQERASNWTASPNPSPCRPSEVSSRLHSCLSWHLLAISWVLVGCHQARHPHCALTSWGSYFCVMGLFSVPWSIWTLLQMCAFLFCVVCGPGGGTQDLVNPKQVSEWGYNHPFLLFILRHGFAKFPRLALNFRSSSQSLPTSWVCRYVLRCLIQNVLNL